MGSIGEYDTSQEAIDIPVLIVGGGPAGLLLAYLLLKLQVPSLVIEKYPQRLAAPKAHALSPRSLEICRQYGLDTGAMRKLGSPREDAYWVNFITNLTRERIGVLPNERMDKEVLDDTPEMLHNIPQPIFEQLVANELAKNPLAELRKGHAFVSCQQTGDDVVATVEERTSGRRYNIRSKYVVGCDGAKSAVREDLGIQCEGEDSYETMMTIHFRADLRPILGSRVGMLHWILDPAVSGFIIGYDLSGDLVLIHNFDVSSRINGNMIPAGHAAASQASNCYGGRSIVSSAIMCCSRTRDTHRGAELAAMSFESEGGQAVPKRQHLPVRFDDRLRQIGTDVLQSR